MVRHSESRASAEIDRTCIEHGFISSLDFLRQCSLSAAPPPDAPRCSRNAAACGLRPVGGADASNADDAASEAAVVVEAVEVEVEVTVVDNDDDDDDDNVILMPRQWRMKACVAAYLRTRCCCRRYSTAGTCRNQAKAQSDQASCETSTSPLTLRHAHDRMATRSGMESENMQLV